MKKISGRTVKTFNLPTKEETGKVNVVLHGYRNGVYAYTLVADGKPIATKIMQVEK